MNFHENNGEDYYRSLNFPKKNVKDEELLEKIREIIDLFHKNGGDFKDPQSRGVLAIIIAEEAEEHYSNIP